MAFWPFESSRSRGRPVELYLFRYDALPTAYYAYTTAENPVSHDDIVYTPVPISRGAVSAAGTLDKVTLEVTTPQNVDLASLFRAYPPSQVVTLEIRQGHVDDPGTEFVVLWSGRVLGCSRESNQAKFACEPISTALRRSGLRRHYQFGCPHALYGSQCRANRIAATFTRTVVTAQGALVSLNDGWASPHTPAKFIGGMLRWTREDGIGETRTILRLSDDGNTLTCGGVLRGLTSGMSADVTLGCNHQMDDCLNLHNNIQNFGGQPWIPFKNPIGPVNNFY